LQNRLTCFNCAYTKYTLDYVVNDWRLETQRMFKQQYYIEYVIELFY